MSSVKFSNFVSTVTPLQIGDIVVGLRDGVNEQFVNNGVTGNIIYQIVQTAHGFIINDVVRLSGGTYVKAQADSATDALAVGIVTTVVDVNTFQVTTNGRISFTRFTLVPGDVYYLDPVTAGNVTNVEPTNPAYIVKAILIADTTNTAILSSDLSSANPLSASNLAFFGNDLISTNTNGPINLVPNGSGVITMSSITEILNAQPLRWYNSANTFYSAFQASASLAGSTTWTLPTADGVAGYAMVTNGSGLLAFMPGSASTIEVTQTAHGFSIGQVLKFNGSPYGLAQADSAPDAEVYGMVSGVIDANHFLLISCGHVSGLIGLTGGVIYFLDPATPGGLTATEPSTTGQISKPLFWADSSTSGFFYNERGKIVPATQAITNLEFSGNSIISLNTNGNIGIIPNGTGIFTIACETDVLNGSPLKWFESTNTYYSAFKANPSLSSSTTWELPLTDGSAGEVLQTSGAGVLSFVPQTGAGFIWSVITSTTQTLVENTGYAANNSALTTFTLPSTASVGQSFAVSGLNTGGWTIAQNSGQNITIFGTSTTSGVTGSLSSDSGNPRSTVFLICSVANTTFDVIELTGAVNTA